MNGLAGYAGVVVSPLLTQAIESVRQHLASDDMNAMPGKLALGRDFKRWPGRQLPDIDDHEQLRKLAPECRMAVFEFEAMAGLMFDKIDKSGRSGEGGRLCQARVEGAVCKVSELVAITRPSLGVLEKQAEIVAIAARRRFMPKSDDVAKRDRLAEINAQVPPPLAFWSAALPLQPDAMPRTLELITLTLSICNLLQQRFKHALSVTRPHKINPATFPAILTPSHASLPSGHATEAFGVAEVLLALLGHPFQPKSKELGELPRMLLALAARVAANREVAGVHYPIDTLAGRMLGTVIATYLAARCGASKTACRGTFSGHALTATSEFAAPDCRGRNLRTGDDKHCTMEPGVEVVPSAALKWLWDNARKEWGA